jgi:large subunit ribosomal protein L10
MSKPVKEMMRRALRGRFEGLQSLALVDLTGVDATATNAIRGRLRAKDIHVIVVKNSLARQAFREIGLAAAASLLDGPCAVAHGGDSVIEVVRELLDIHKETPALTVKAAVLEGEPFGPERVAELSSYPTRAEAIAKVLSCALAPGRKLAACLRGPGAALAGILKTIEEKQGGGEQEQAA